ncbi:cupin domain-containing protein [Dongia mobilis]|uniref:cupin domain-containing protein n=1 Tax=Dongia sp. TaxID=1977262 RepID=UPI0026EC4782
MSADSNSRIGNHIRVAEVVIPCPNLAADLQFFTERLGFKVNLIFPADAPATAVISGHGLMLRLIASKDAGNHTPLLLRLLCDLQALPAGTPDELTAPGGTRIQLVDAQNPVIIPAGTQEFVISRGGKDSWGVGRAGMQYRDLIPSRLGGRFVASHIRIPDGGPVPDYVHFHKIRFQMIFCKTGWARLVYEDQGEPFLLNAGDCVLQPPEIRHRVLEASPGLEVIEIGCPAIHETCADHNMVLPTGRTLPDRLYGDQRFVRHIAAEATWQPWRLPGFEARDIGIAAATSGLADVHVVRPTSRIEVQAPAHGGEFLFLFVLAGELKLSGSRLGTHTLLLGDSVAIPADATYALAAEPDAEILEVKLPTGA